MSKFNQIASTWDSNPKVVETATATVEAIKKIVDTKDKDILDYGAGTGLLSFGFFEDAASIECMDNSYGMLKQLGEKIKEYNATNMVTTLHDIDIEGLPSEKYDVMISNMTMHHFQNPKDFLQKVYDSIKPEGGYACVADLDEEDGSFHGDNEGVQHFGFSEEYVRNAYEEAGFEMVFFDYIHTISKAKDYKIFLAIGKKG